MTAAEVDAHLSYLILIPASLGASSNRLGPVYTYRPGFLCPSPGQQMSTINGVRLF